MHTCWWKLSTIDPEQALERDRLELAAEIAARGPTQASKAEPVFKRVLEILKGSEG